MALTVLRLSFELHMRLACEREAIRRRGGPFIDSLAPRIAECATFNGMHQCSSVPVSSVSRPCGRPPRILTSTDSSCRGSSPMVTCSRRPQAVTAARLFLLWSTLVAGLITFDARPTTQSKPDFSGEWIMVLDKSDFGTAPTPAAMTRTIVHKEPTIKIVSLQTGGATGDRTSEVTYSTDGKSQANTVDNSPMATVGRWDGEALVFSSDVSVRGMTFAVEERFVLSDVGKTLTMTRAIHHTRGTQMTKILFRKR